MVVHPLAFAAISYHLNRGQTPECAERIEGLMLITHQYNGETPQKEVVQLARFCPSTEEERQNMLSLLSYVSCMRNSRTRWGKSARKGEGERERERRMRKE